MTVGTTFSDPPDFSRNISDEMQEEHQKSKKLVFHISIPASRTPKFGKLLFDKVLALNASATKPSSSTSGTKSIISNQSTVKSQITTTQDTAGNNSSKDLIRGSSSRNGISDVPNNQEETQECQSCGVKFKAGKSMTTRDEFLYGEKYCNACRNVIGGAEPSPDSGRRIKEEEERSSPGLKKQKQETTDKKKTWKKWPFS